MTSPNAVSAFQFKKLKTGGSVLVLNERSYLMGTYSTKTGATTWERVVLATQKANVEAWLREHFPIVA